jgi:hypothetical protein
MIQLTVNGKARRFEGDPDMPLLWFLRDELQLTGTKFGCGLRLCGACTVHVNGEAARSCSTPMSELAGKKITTIEGLAVKGEHPLQKAWKACSVPQCKIPRVDIALDAGRIINPERVKAQFEGAVVFGAGIALMSEITATGGRVQQGNFDGYRVARMNQAPLVTNVYIVNSDEAPAGVGEPGVPPIAPAICNAVFAATGKRIRELPIKKQLA